MLKYHGYILFLVCMSKSAIIFFLKALPFTCQNAKFRVQPNYGKLTLLKTTTKYHKFDEVANTNFGRELFNADVSSSIST